MSDEPDIDKFRRFLQEELEMTSTIQDPVKREQKRWMIEAALQYAIAFDESTKILLENEAIPFEVSSGVRLLSKEESYPEIETEESEDANSCSSCGEEYDHELDFCPTCGKLR